MQECQRHGKNEGINFIAICNANNPMDLKISLCPKNDFTYSVLGPAYSKKKSLHEFDRSPSCFQTRQNIKPIPEETSIDSVNPSDPSPIDQEVISIKVRPTDYSTMRSSLITECIRFEILLDDTADVDVCTKALVIFGKLVNVSPFCKIVAYHDEDSNRCPFLDKSHDLPTPIKEMSKYVSAPILNHKARKLHFHARFRSVVSLLEMKTDQEFMLWPKTNFFLPRS